MKKIKTLFFVAFTGALFWGAPKDARAADTIAVDVLLSIQTANIEGVLTSVRLAAFPGTSQVSSRVIVRNPLVDTSVPEDFSLRISSETGSWNRVTTNAPLGVNEYRLRAIWAVYTATLTVARFEDDDILTGSSQMSSPTVFFSQTGRAEDVGIPAEIGGFAVPPGGERNLFFRFDAGAPGTAGSLTSHITIQATPLQ